MSKFHCLHILDSLYSLEKKLFFLTDQNFVFSICMTENGLKAVTICSLYDLFKLPTCALNQHVCMN